LWDSHDPFLTNLTKKRYSAFLPALYVRSEIRSTDELRVDVLHGMTVFRSHALVWRPRSPARLLFRDLADRIRAIAANSLSDEVSIARA